MATWLSLQIEDDQWDATTKEAAITAAGILTEGFTSFNFTFEQSKKITQAQIRYCLDNNLSLTGTIASPYFIILPITLANSNVPAGFPDRTYIDENEVEQVRKVKDYVATYWISQDGLTALIRCTYKPTNEERCGVSLTVDDYMLWYNVAMNQSVHTAVSPDGLIELEQAQTLLAGDYAPVEEG